MWAQDVPNTTAPTFTAQTLEARIETLEANTELSEEQKSQIRASLGMAVDRLAEATRQSERRAQFSTAVEDATALQAELDVELKAAQDALSADLAPMAEMIGDGALFELEQELRAKESDLAEIETRLQGLQNTLNTLSTRQEAAPQELSEARAALSDLQTRLNALGDGELEALSEARRTEVQARVWYRRNQIRALEQEIATLPSRQDLVGGRRAVADIRAQILRRDVARISTRTGQKRVNEARDLRNRIAALSERSDTSHPVVAKYASSNLDLADQIAEIAAESPIVSQATASVRGRFVDVENDLSAAMNLVEQGRLDREAGETLRRLGNQLQTPDSIRADIRESENRRSKAVRQRIIAQEDLRDLPLGVYDLDAFVDAAKQDMPQFPELSEIDKATLSTIVDTRRDLLRQISSLSNSRVTAVSDLRTAQISLLEQTESLQTLLDENLLWVRSVPAIDGSFLQKLGLGALNFFSPNNFSLAASELLQMVRSYSLVVIGFLIITGLIFRFRSKVWEDVNRRSKLVGRVQEDNAWHTPAVIASGVFHSLPLPLIFLLVALLYSLSDNPDRLIKGLANGFAYLSIFTLLFGSWIRWDREKGLFDAHFKLPDGLRRSIGRNLRWFVPVTGTILFFLAVTNDMADENITEGFSVFVFFLTALSMMIFSARILWSKSSNIPNFANKDSALSRFKGLIALIVIGVPLTTIGLAAAGYYESANEILSRLFITGVLVLLTYVIYGSIRRAIVVAQRQLKYRQALEKREAELKARRDKEAAEERGEEMPLPPPINTKDIDVTTITRQTSKLLRTVILLGFAGLLWMIWGSLVPALSIFDGFSVWTIEGGARDTDGAVIDRIISLWDILQSLVILALTFIAARNLPGFLEIFVLNRLGVDAGTRYAVTTVLGYIIIAVGIIIGFNQLGLQWSQLKWIATGLSVGIGFGLQKIIANFVSGLIILFERPIRIGDYVTIGDQSGTVSRIKIRATTLKDLDNLEILIPNEALISERVTNWTLSSSITRLIVNVGIAYGSDTDRAREIMLAAVKELPKVLTTPPPNVLFMGFGDSSLDFQVRVHLSSFDDRVPMTHVIHTEVNKALEAAGIPIPFPQRDLNIVSQNIPLEFLSNTSTKAKRKKTGGPNPTPKPSKP
ncbi:MAG: mechanosensitive ion channel domain-containing protein [Litorimonas sp.]